MEDMLDAYLSAKPMRLDELAEFYSALIGCLQARVGRVAFDDCVAWTIKFMDERKGRDE